MKINIVHEIDVEELTTALTSWSKSTDNDNDEQLLLDAVAVIKALFQEIESLRKPTEETPQGSVDFITARFNRKL